MLGKVFSIICIIAIICGIATGNISELGGAALDGAQDAITLTIALCGMMCLWTGIMNVLSKGGVVKMLSKLMMPLIKMFFPQSYESGDGIDEICTNISANFLGIGNAATPLALSALRKMQERNLNKEYATNDMITLTVLNTASFSLMPTTLIAVRRAAGSVEPFSIIVPIWICSAASALFALVLCRICGMVRDKMTAASEQIKSTVKGKKNDRKNTYNY